MKKIFVTCLILVMSLGGLKAASANEKLFFDANNAPQVTVLNYHHFGYEEEHPEINNIRITPELFKEQLKALKKKGYSTITLEQFLTYIQGYGLIPEKSVLITIDDGYKSVYQYAYPILKELKMQAVIFPITGDMQLGSRKGAPMMSFEDLHEMVESDVFEVGSHTHDLHWRGKDDSVGYEAMVWGFDKSEKRLWFEKFENWLKDDIHNAENLIFQSTGTQVKSIAYPYGAYNDTVLKVMNDLNYEVGFTTNSGYTLFGSGLENPLEINRITILDKHSPTWIINRLIQYNTDAISMIENSKDIRVETNKTTTDISIQAWSHSNSAESVSFEVYRNQNGIRSYAGKSATSNQMLNESIAIGSTLESFEESEVYQNYGKGDYSVKVILSYEDGTKQIEWVDYTY